MDRAMAIQSLFIVVVLLFHPATSGEKYVKHFKHVFD